MNEIALQPLAEGILAVTGGVSNRGIITQDGNVLVVDAGISVAEGTQVRHAADQFHQGGSMLLFNTHPHGDHVFGNQAFTGYAIVAQAGVRDNLVTAGAQMLAGWRQDPGLAPLLDDITITPPTVTFAEQLTVYVGTLEVQLRHVGAAHSPSDSVAWLPQTRILFAGDVLFNGLVPMLPPGSNSRQWVQALETLEVLGAEQVIAGHGAVEPPTALAALREWLLTLRQEVRQRRAQGLALDALLPQVQAVMAAYDLRKAQERLPMAIRQVYADLEQEQG